MSTEKPVFAVYRSALFPDMRRTIEVWREEAAARGAELYLCRVESFNAAGREELAVGFDAAIEFQPFTPAMTDFWEHRPWRQKLMYHLRKLWGDRRKMRKADYDAYVAYSLSRPAPDYKLLPFGDAVVGQHGAAQAADVPVPQCHAREIRPLAARGAAPLQTLFGGGEFRLHQRMERMGRRQPSRTRYEMGGNTLRRRCGQSRRTSDERDRIPESQRDRAGAQYGAVARSLRRIGRAQTLRDIEIILVENRSTDASPELCDAYPAADARIRVLHLAEAGRLSRARNAGLAVATAPYVGFVDSDDYIEPDMFRRLYDAAVESRAQIAYGDPDLRRGGDAAAGRTRGAGDHPHARRGIVRPAARTHQRFGLHPNFFDRTLFEGSAIPARRLVRGSTASSTNGSPDAGGSPHMEKVCYHYVQRDGSICPLVQRTEALPLLSGQFRAFRRFVRRWQRLFEGRTEQGTSATSWCRNCLYNFGRRAPQTCPRFPRRPSGYAPETGADVRGGATLAGDAKALGGGS